MKKIYVAALLAFAICITGCGQSEQDKTSPEGEVGGEQAGEDTATASADDQKTGLANETAEDGHVDFTVLQKENPEIFAWIYVPGTNIDAPLLQSAEADDYYRSHTADRSEGDGGALYTEMANLMNMCDFNTVIHGQDTEETDLLSELHRFEDPDFFEKHPELYIYLPDNVLTYTIFAAYNDESSDILRRYDYTTYEGCQQYLDTFYGTREMNMNVREGWEDLTPGHFLLTLDGTADVKTDGQYVVLAALVQDAAGKIDRVFYRQ